MSKPMQLGFICLIVAFAASAHAANINWSGANADANGVGYWDDVANWNGGELPTMGDRAQLLLSDSATVVDDWDSDTVKEAMEVRIGWGVAHKNVTLLITSATEDGPGGVLTTDLLRMAVRGAENSRLQVDAGHLIVNGQLRTGRDNNASAFIEINGGTVDCLSMNLTELANNYTEAGLTMNGGELNVAGSLTTSGLPGKSFIHLNGGTARIGSLGVKDDFTLDVNGGELLLDGDKTGQIATLIQNGQVTAAGGDPVRYGLVVAYDTETDTTRITNDPELVDLNKAWNPAPVGTDVEIDQTRLTWSAGDGTAATAGHDVYLGIDRDAVANDSGDNALGTYLGTVDAAEITMPNDLAMAQTYYWRVDQIEQDTGAIHKGDVWKFVVADSQLVDDFESYTADDGTLAPDDPNLVYNVWKDGYEVADNGSVVFLEQRVNDERTGNCVVRQGVQSLKVAYANGDAVVNSEITRAFAGPQDWSRYGLKSLSLHFHGGPENTFDQVYVKINDFKVPYDLSEAHVKTTQWYPWIIDLKNVNTDLSNVTSLAIGIDGGTTGENQVLYVDNIRLYGEEGRLIAPKAPDDASLVAHYTFDGNAQDSSGNGNHGTLVKNAGWVDGIIDGALDISACEGIDFANFDPTGGTGVFTFSTWIRWDGTGSTQHFLSKTAGWGADTMMFQIELKGNSTNSADRNRMALAYQGADQAKLHVIPAGEWVHTALVFDGKTATGYLNGVPQTDPVPTGIGDYVDCPVHIGKTFKENPSSGGWRNIQGLLDDVRLYNYPLTEEEIRGLSGMTDDVYKGF